MQAHVPLRYMAKRGMHEHQETLMVEDDLPALARLLGGSGEATGNPPTFRCDCPTMRHIYKAPNGCLALSWGKEGLRAICSERCSVDMIEKAIRKEFLTPPRKLTKREMEERAATEAARAARWAAHDWDKPLIDEDLYIRVSEKRWCDYDENRKIKKFHGWKAWIENTKTGCFRETAYPFQTREKLLKMIYGMLPIWRRRVQLPERWTKPKTTAAVATKPTGPKWIKSKRGGCYIRLPAGTFTVFAVGSRWGISWFPVGGTQPVYALEDYVTIEEARAAVDEKYRAQVPATAPEPPKPMRASDYPPMTQEELDAILIANHLRPGPCVPVGQQPLSPEVLKRLPC